MAKEGRRRAPLWVAALVGVLVAGAATLTYALLAASRASTREGGTAPTAVVSPGTPSPSPIPSSSPKATPSASPSPSVTVTPTAFPLASAFRKVRRWLATRTGYLGLAVIDSSGRLYGWHADRMFISGSVTKAMLLVQYLRTHASISDDMRRVLTSMIEYSDNDCADIVYAAVGRDAALRQVASLVHMRNFVANEGFWGYSYINAADQARFFLIMDSLIPIQHRAFAQYILSHVVRFPYGIPKVARPLGWTVYFKGGWRTGLHGNRLIHQVARLQCGKTVIAIAVLTDGSPTDAYAVATIEGVAERLLAE
jgi:hypothetical protein